MIGCRPNHCGTAGNPNTGNLRTYPSANITASGCIFDNAHGQGALVEGTGSTFSSCVFTTSGIGSTTGNYYHGLKVTGANNNFAACQFKYNYYGSGVRVEGNRNTFTSCNFRSNGVTDGTNPYRGGYGMNFKSGVLGNVVIGNVFYLNQTGACNIASGTNYIHHNHGIGD